MKKQEVFESLQAPIYVHIKNKNGMFKVVAVGLKHFVIEVKNENNKKYKVDYARFFKISNNDKNKQNSSSVVDFIMKYSKHIEHLKKPKKIYRGYINHNYLDAISNGKAFK